MAHPAEASNVLLLATERDLCGLRHGLAVCTKQRDDAQCRGNCSTDTPHVTPVAMHWANLGRAASGTSDKRPIKLRDPRRPAVEAPTLSTQEQLSWHRPSC